jgi:cellulose synthase/poly-beta-1,6-N-acetylglucosamine synthase-like glycosyltransferase
VLIPVVSVVVPFYNERRYLGRCIQAILAQDYPPDHYEVILVDDGSGDSSGEIARRQVDVRQGKLPCMVYARLRHCGLAAARNAGLSLAQGDIIAYVDGDALAEPGWLTGLVTTFGDDPRVGIVGGKINALNDEVTFAEFIHWIHYFWPDRARGERILVVGTNMAFRRAVFERVGGFFTNFWQRGDETTFLLKAERFFTARTTAEAVVRHERPDRLSRWLRERYYNGYFYASELYILRQIETSPADIRAHLVRYLLLAHNACLPVWMGLLAVWSAWPICLIAVLSWVIFGAFLWSRRRIGHRLKVLGREYGLRRAVILAPYAVGLVALGEYVRAVGCIVGLWHFRGQSFDDDLQAAAEPIEYTHTNVVDVEP